MYYETAPQTYTFDVCVCVCIYGMRVIRQEGGGANKPLPKKPSPTSSTLTTNPKQKDVSVSVLPAISSLFSSHYVFACFALCVVLWIESL